MKNKKIIIIGIVVLAIVITALILIFRKKPEDSEENSNNSTNPGSGTSQNAGISLAEAGFPIKKGVSKRKEVYDMQVKLVNDYGANVFQFQIGAIIN